MAGRDTRDRKGKAKAVVESDDEAEVEIVSSDDEDKRSRKRAKPAAKATDKRASDGGGRKGARVAALCRVCAAAEAALPLPPPFHGVTQAAAQRSSSLRPVQAAARAA